MRLLLTGLICAASMQAATWYVTVAGLGGEPDYEQRFQAWAMTIDNILRGSRTDARIETLTGAQATRERVRQVLERAAQESKPEDSIVVMLIGHGTFDGSEYKLALPGPDLSASELAALLNKNRAERQLVVNMTSSSGGSLEALRKEGRIVIAATKSGTQRNVTVFPRYWAEALRDAAADTDKNEAISALEAFRYASAKTAAFYEAQRRLATEHAVMDDAGTGAGVRDPSGEKGEGRLAAAFTLLRFGAAQAAAQDPAKQKLLARREQIEQEIDRLKYQKAAIPADEYKKELTKLLLQLARIQEEIEK
ncbi:MAG: hypothetical protein K6T61_02065 [Bryobacteraceae bacterium]|nr:hypothetical protein [Bryobacteraceae bacterium]